MGLYINRNQQNIYRTEKPVGNNQDIYVYNRASELAKAQKKYNEMMQRNIVELHEMYASHQKADDTKWGYLQNQFKAFETFGKDQETVVQEVLQQINTVEAEQRKLLQTLKMEQSTVQNSEDKWRELAEAYEKILLRLETIMKEHEIFSQKMQEQLLNQEKISKLWKVQHHKLDQLDKRIENQEAMSEKITRQLEYLRSVLFERTHYLAEKIEELYKDLFQLLNKRGEESRKKTFVVHNKWDSKV